MKILLFGGSGQVGQEFRKRAKDLNFEVISPVTSEVNITDREQVSYLAEKIRPEVILNCAAYTAVDDAEENREIAFEVNANGASYVAEAAKAAESRLIHISTDYVFPGTGTEPLKESAEVGPINVYGASKLAGERAIQSVLGDSALIVRSSSIHGSAGKNIVKTVVNLLKQRDRLEFVDDQIMSPTWAGWLAEALVDLSRIECGGILHACCSGEVSWYGFAQKIKEIALKSASDVQKEIVPVKTEDFPRPAKRPAYSVLATERLEGVIGREPITWQEGLESHMKELGYG